MNIKNLCFELADLVGISGDEYKAAEIISSYLSEYMPCEVTGNASVIGTTDVGSTHILLDAHLDQVGLIVRGIDEKGFLLIDKVGGIDERVLTGAEVTVHAEKELFGVICSVPPHLSAGDDKKVSIKTMAVDVGLEPEKAKELVCIGDRITLRNFQHELCGDNISSSAFDDRASVAAILYALELTKGKIPSLKLSVLFSSQEETGHIGAKTGAFSLMPDYAVAVDVGFGNDPYTDKTDTITLSGGPSIGISPILDKDFTNELIALAEKNEIPYQHDFMGRSTGTNADEITVTGTGVKTALLSIPLRYMHTANEIINLKDIENTGKLIASYLLSKEAQQNA